MVNVAQTPDWPFTPSQMARAARNGQYPPQGRAGRYNPRKAV